MPQPQFTPKKDPVSILQQTGWAPGPVWMGRKSDPHQDSVPDRPAGSQSLYWLNYPAHPCVSKQVKIHALSIIHQNFSQSILMNKMCGPQHFPVQNIILIMQFLLWRRQCDFPTSIAQAPVSPGSIHSILWHQWCLCQIVVFTTYITDILLLLWVKNLIHSCTPMILFFCTQMLVFNHRF